ncbi:DNA-binding IclR family transcriptional regulator [Spinactinospora alkalitolerans]|uniref:DNA-binding IclR family transcriptional regulator n=1 Tax=Spinactinospora alkalitolerans TaxID=687207 RepID=A0A852TSQ0_9ACTN|nr:IclR family transcriptional regulator [Spinactinospora alkalitolerans]NYE46307.1 DNA-binding IclR family transcriptional regulator [Spinactinospora alkalitolerans]
MRSVITALHVLDAVAERQPIGVSDLARAMDIPKSSVQRALRALESAGWIRSVAPEQGSGWVLTTKAGDLAQHIAGDLGVREAALPVMAELRDRTGEEVHLTIREDQEVVVIERVESTHPVRIHWPAGTRSPCHASANGKAILAHLRPADLAVALPGPLPGFTESTITAPEKLRAELAAVRARGYAVARSELRADIASVAAPILSPSGTPIAALSVFLPMHRLDDDTAPLGELVRANAQRIAAAVATR